MSGFQNRLCSFSLSFGKRAFLSGKVVFCGQRHFRQSQVSEIGFIFFSQGFGKVGSGFLVRFILLAKDLVCKVISSASVLASQALAFSISAVVVSARSVLPKIL